jgi:FkbM family methyltransferase
MTDSVEVLVNDRWSLRVPEHRAGHWKANPTWEPERLRSMAANLRPGMVVYDIGAEQGDLSALFATWVAAEPEPGVIYGEDHPLASWKPGGGVVLAEPAPWYWPTIRATFEANDLPAPFASFCGFAGDETRPGHGNANVWAASGWPRVANGEPSGREAFRHISDNGPAITLDDLAEFAGRPPDVINMDIEGAEILAIRGAQRVLAEHRPLVWVSVHAEAMFNDWGVYQAEFHSEFHRNGYEKVLLGFDHELHTFYYPGEKRDEVALPCTRCRHDHPQKASCSS